MRYRLLLALLSFALAAAACGQGAGTTGDTITLRYSYQPGDSLTYALTQQMTMAMTMTGAGDIGVPGTLDMNMDMDLVSRLEYEVDEGPNPETIRMTIGMTIIEGSGTIDTMGTTEEMSFDDILSEFGSMEIALILDAQGDVIEIVVGGHELPPGLFGDLGNTSGFGLGSPEHIGPQFPDGPIEVGRTWNTEVVNTSFGIETRVVGEHRITGTEVVAGRDTYRIETITTTDPIVVDFEDLVNLITENAEAFGQVAPEADMASAVAAFEMLDIEMNYRIDGFTIEMTSWFDAGEGVLIRAEWSGPMTMFMEMKNLPDGGDMEMSLEMTMAQTMQLTD